MLSKELVHDVLAEVGRTQYAPCGEWPLHKKRKPDQMIQGGAKFLQVGFNICKYVAPLRCRISNSAPPLFEWFVVVGSGGVASQKNKSFCPGDDRAFPPRHQTAALQFFVEPELHCPSYVGPG